MQSFALLPLFVMIQKLQIVTLFFWFFLYKNSYSSWIIFVYYWYFSNFFVRNSRNSDFVSFTFRFEFVFCIFFILNCNSDSSSIILSRGNCNSRQMTSLIKLFEFRSRIFSNVRTMYAVHIKYFPMLFSNNLLLLRALV